MFVRLARLGPNAWGKRKWEWEWERKPSLCCCRAAVLCGAGAVSATTQVAVAQVGTPSETAARLAGCSASTTKAWAVLLLVSTCCPSPPPTNLRVAARTPARRLCVQMQVSTLPGVHVVGVACGANFVLGLADDGRVFSWGSGQAGQVRGATDWQPSQSELALARTRV